MGTWTNDDGLYLKTGQTEADVTKGGSYRHHGPLALAEVEILWSDLAATATEKIMADNVTIPNGAHIEKAEFYVETAFVGATATLSFGMLDQDRSTAIGTTKIGIDDTIAVTAIDAIGDTVDCDGALVNTTLTNTGLLTATEGTAAFTAGKGLLRIYYYM